MSDTEDQLPGLELEDSTPKARKKTAAKRTAKKATARKSARKSARKKAADTDSDVRDSAAGDSHPAPAKEVYSASPDDMDDYGDVHERRTEADAPPAPKDSAPTHHRDHSASDESTGGQQDGNVSAEAPVPAQADNRRNNDSRGGQGGQHGGGHREKFKSGGNHHGGGQSGGHHGGGQSGGPPFGKKDKFNKFKGNQKGQNPFGKKGGKFQKPGGPRKKGWNPVAGFGAHSDDDRDPPEFESLLEWDVLRDPEALQSYMGEAFSGLEPWDFNTLREKSLPELEQAVKDSGLSWDGAPGRRKLIDLLLGKAREDKRPLEVSGLVELLEEGYAFVVFASDNYRIRSDSPFIPAPVVRRAGLQRGHRINALMQAPRVGDSTPCVLRVDQVMGRDPEEARHLVPFTELVPYYPLKRTLMECSPETLGKWDNISMRVVDLLTPVGLGQRGLIVAPPRTGKTVLLQGIANALRINSPDVHLIILLVDERPEEVTDFKRSVPGAEVISSTFDESAESHVHAAEMVIEKARRMVEAGMDVVILLDSITRLARAYNTLMPSSGKILSGGVEASALQKPKRFFGSARNIEDGGSLTILGTALVETGSKMDEVIFEEFKGTGNMELHLDRELSNKRIYPSLNFEKSGTRKEELLYHPDEMAKIHALRRAMKGVHSAEAMEMLITRVKKTKTNAEFLMGLNR